MATLPLQPYDAKTLTCSRDRKMLAGDMSDLRMQPGFTYPRLYDDAMDVGIAFHNDATGFTTVWYWVEDVIRDGDLLESRFKPTNETVRKLPHLEGYQLILFND